MNTRQIRSVAVIAGARTPFCKAGGAFLRRSAVQLGAVAARETMLRAGIRPDRVEQIIFGIVSAPVGAPNIAREIGLEAAFPASVPAYTISRAQGLEPSSTWWERPTSRSSQSARRPPSAVNTPKRARSPLQPSASASAASSPNRDMR